MPEGIILLSKEQSSFSTLKGNVYCKMNVLCKYYLRMMMRHKLLASSKGWNGLLQCKHKPLRRCFIGTLAQALQLGARQCKSCGIWLSAYWRRILAPYFGAVFWRRIFPDPSLHTKKTSKSLFTFVFVFNMLARDFALAVAGLLN